MFVAGATEVSHQPDSYLFRFPPSPFGGVVFRSIDRLSSCLPGRPTGRVCVFMRIDGSRFLFGSVSHTLFHETDAPIRLADAICWCSCGSIHEYRFHDSCNGGSICWLLLVRCLQGSDLAHLLGLGVSCGLSIHKG